MVNGSEELGWIAVEGRRIGYRLIRSRRRSLSVAVTPDMRITVRAPSGAGRRAIEAFLKARAVWIGRALARFQQCRRLAAPRRYASGERLAFLGGDLRLEVVPGPPGPPERVGESLRVVAAAEGKAVRRAVDAWYRARALEVFPRVVAGCLPATARLGIPTPRLSVRAMRSRWGSARPPDRITLSTHLVKVPVALIEYVAMHELCHLRRPDHSPAFYALLSACLPDWRARREALQRLFM